LSEHPETKPPSYGHLRLFVQAVMLAAVLATASHAAAARTLRLVALGDSLTAGYGLPPGKAFPDRLEAALRAKGWDVKVINAGVSGDTAADGLARYDWSVPQDADALIVELAFARYNKGAPLIADVMPAIAQRGLHCIDVCELHRRPAGGVLQIDLLFVKPKLFDRFCTQVGLR